jgi:hypothetical protein
MNNLLETLKNIGFEPDFPGDHISLYLQCGENEKLSLVIRMSDCETHFIPSDETKKFRITADIMSDDGTIQEFYQ